MIVQVERIVDCGSLPQRLIHIPGALVDKVGPCIWIKAVPRDKQAEMPSCWAISVGLAAF